MDRRFAFAIAPAVVLLLGFAGRAHAGEEASACVAAFEDAQRFRADQRLRAAREALATCSRTVCPRVVGDRCRKWKDAVEAAIPSVALKIVDAGEGRVSGAAVSIDGKSVTLPDDGVVTLDPGPHAARAERAGYEPNESRFELKPGEKAVPITIRLARVAPPPATSATATPERPPAEIPTASYVLGGVGVVAIGAFAYLGLKGKSDEDRLASTCSPACNPDDVSAVKTKYIAADVALGIGVVALGVATWMALDGTSNASTSTAALGIGPAGVAFRGRF